MNPDRTLPWDWHPGKVPENAQIDPEAYLETTYSFNLFRGERSDALQVGRGASIYLGVMFDVGPQGRVSIGQFTLINGARIICDAEVSIGDYCLISWNTVFMDSNRSPTDVVARRKQLERAAATEPRRIEPIEAGRPIRIGRNVWIGFEACVLPGVSIGEGSVVGARSVVVEDLPPYSVAVGNPARILRQLAPSPATENA